MEGLIVIVTIWGGFILLSWLNDKLKEHLKQRKIRIKDKATQETLKEAKINKSLIRSYKEKLKRAGYVRDQGISSFWIDIMSDGGKKYRGLIKKCPACEQGTTRIVKGKYGKFLGCSNYPACKHTEDLEKAKREYDEKSRKEFIEQLEVAYK